MADLIQFDAGSGQRIADVVRIVESQFPHARPLNFDRVFSDAKKAKVFRICTFEGAWSTYTDKTVTFKYQEATPNTVSATNLFFPVPPSASSRDCAIAKDGTAWFLVDVPMETATAVFARAFSEIPAVSSIATADRQVVSAINLSASFNTLSCAVTIGSTLTYTTLPVVISWTTAHVSLVSQTFTSSFTRFSR